MDELANLEPDLDWSPFSRWATKAVPLLDQLLGAGKTTELTRLAKAPRQPGPDAPSEKLDLFVTRAKRRKKELASCLEGLILAYESRQQTIPEEDSRTMKILMFASNSASTEPLDLASEAREIRQRMLTALHRSSFQLETAWAARPNDIITELLNVRPTVVHFSGHGTGQQGIVMQGDGGEPRLVSGDALRRTFKALKDDIRVVVLNACHSAEQAEAIKDVIDFVVGMRTEIGDDSARSFAAAFYQALTSGRSVQTAFDVGLAAIDLNNLDEENVPVLFVRTGASAESALIGPLGRPDATGVI